MTYEYTVPEKPCLSCPYKCATPSGIWAEEEYEKLPKFDGDMGQQAMNGALGLFLCHLRTGDLCAGWVATHGADNLLGLRLNGDKVDPAVWTYKSPVPVFASGQEAYEHGVQDIDAPSEEAEARMKKLGRVRGIKTLDDE